MPWVDSVVVLRDGAPLVEEHFYGRRPEHLHPLHSATKSVTSLVFGCLVDDGLIDLDAPVWRYLGARQGRRWIDDKLDVRVHDVLAMSAGVDWLEEGVPHSDPSNDNSRMNRSGDWVGYVLDKPLRPDWPAGDFEYQSGLSVLAGGIIAAVAGRPVPEVARERIFTPLGIHAFRWLTTPDGTAHTGGGLMLRPRDFAALGQLVLDGGRWDGQQVLSAEWVARSTAQQSDVGDRVVWPSVTGYGYQWWRNAFECDGRTHTAVSAMGFGGQQLHVFSDLGAVVAVTAHDWLGAGALTEAAEHVLRTIAD